MAPPKPPRPPTLPRTHEEYARLRAAFDKFEKKDRARNPAKYERLAQALSPAELAGELFLLVGKSNDANAADVAGSYAVAWARRSGDVPAHRLIADAWYHIADAAEIATGIFSELAKPRKGEDLLPLIELKDGHVALAAKAFELGRVQTIAQALGTAPLPA